MQWNNGGETGILPACQGPYPLPAERLERMSLAGDR